MINDENNNLDMKQQMRKKELFVKKIEIYEELNEEEKRKILPSILPALGGIIILSAINKYNSYDVIYPIIVGSMLVGYSIFEIAVIIAKKAGYKNKINEIKEKLESYKLKNNQETIQDGTLVSDEIHENSVDSHDNEAKRKIRKI